MPYIVHYQLPVYHQPTFEDILYDRIGNLDPRIPEKGSTRTYFTDNVNPKLLQMADIPGAIRLLHDFNQQHAELFQKPRESLYYTFHIPKRTGGLRRIDAPCDELMNALRQLKNILEHGICKDPLACHHTSAYAYIHGRSTVDTMKRHQKNGSWWFLKTDFSNFFGSTTEEFLMRMMGLVFPFSEIMRYQEGYSALSKVISLCFLNGGLPQGTPISPFLTNLMMIPVDHKLFNTLHSYNNHTFVYTRYADDIQISSRQNFNQNEIVGLIDSVLDEFNAPFRIKPEKTRYGSRAGQNWNLGVMLNKDNQITIGWKKKRQFKAMITNYALDHKNGNPWSLEEVYSLNGYISHYNSVEPDFVEKEIKHTNEKFSVNVKAMIREDLR